MSEVIKLIWTSMLFTSLMGLEAIAVGYKVEYIITFSAIITIIWAFLILSRSLFAKFSNYDVSISNLLRDIMLEVVIGAAIAEYLEIGATDSIYFANTAYILFIILDTVIAYIKIFKKHKEIVASGEDSNWKPYSPIEPITKGSIYEAMTYYAIRVAVREYNKDE